MSAHAEHNDLLGSLKCAAKTHPEHRTVIDLGGQHIGGDARTVIAGPCSVESEAQIHAIAEQVAAAGATILRGGVYKPRTSPYAFQGLGAEGLGFLVQAAKEQGMLSITEVTCVSDVDRVASSVDILQVGSRNMHNYRLLQAVGKVKKPVFLKRGMAATYREFLLAAEYILSCGNPDVMLCERGIRTFEPYTRNTLDLAAVPVLQGLTHLPVFIDPSHGTGRRALVPSMAAAAMAAGADGLMIEVHTDPDDSISDSQQTVSTEAFAALMHDLSCWLPLDNMAGKASA